jgi:hypothetical protein
MEEEASITSVLETVYIPESIYEKLCCAATLADIEPGVYIDALCNSWLQDFVEKIGEEAKHGSLN